MPFYSINFVNIIPGAFFDLVRLWLGLSRTDFCQTSTNPYNHGDIRHLILSHLAILSYLNPLL